MARPGRPGLCVPPCITVFPCSGSLLGKKLGRAVGFVPPKSFFGSQTAGGHNNKHNVTCTITYFSMNIGIQGAETVRFFCWHDLKELFVYCCH